MEYFLPLAMMISFLAVYLLSPVAKKFLYAVGIVGLDLHKKNRPKISSGGGIIVAFGILTGLFLYIGLETFLGQNNFGVEEFLAVTSSILIVTFVGFLDDLNVKSRPTKTKEGKDFLPTQPTAAAGNSPDCCQCRTDNHNYPIRWTDKCWPSLSISIGSDWNGWCYEYDKYVGRVQRF